MEEQRKVPERGFTAGTVTSTSQPQSCEEVSGKSGTATDREVKSSAQSITARQMLAKTPEQSLAPSKRILRRAAESRPAADLHAQASGRMTQSSPQWERPTQILPWRGTEPR